MTQTEDALAFQAKQDLFMKTRTIHNARFNQYRNLVACEHNWFEDPVEETEMARAAYVWLRAISFEMLGTKMNCNYNYIPPYKHERL